MKAFTLIVCACLPSAFGQTGGITGSVLDDTGAPVEGARVVASLWSSTKAVPFVAGRPPAFMPVPAKATSGAKGEFQIEGIFAGKYYVCVEKPEAALLNPCLWADQPESVNVDEGVTTRGIAVTVTKGVSLNVRIQDSKGLLRANPAADDVRVGTFHRVSPFIPGTINGRDPAGRSISVIVPRGKAASISISSAAFDLADEKGTPLVDVTIPVTAAAVGNAGATPIITIHVASAKASKP
ncbi:carboxypeptidase-like regulatory domain-containing protein [Paludibaculum fermentans]|uniref:carboxypeptidase-like regulatory domain-containing protein n=1 Tax=Paludibaculum fermentans TaxID=1473598 RepID=UPI003EC0C3B0